LGVAMKKSLVAPRYLSMEDFQMSSSGLDLNRNDVLADDHATGLSFIHAFSAVRLIRKTMMKRYCCFST
jgi:hypothetical protein